MDALEAIATRRSVRVFKPDPVEPEKIGRMLEAARWAPSGLNNQPWRFRVVAGRDKDWLAPLTRYGAVILAAPAAIIVCIDLAAVYDRDKDMMGIGACIQNMLLAANSQCLGCCWIGEILKNKDKVSGVLGLAAGLELCAVVAVGYPKQRRSGGTRKNMEDLMV